MKSLDFIPVSLFAAFRGCPVLPGKAPEDRRSPAGRGGTGLPSMTTDHHMKRRKVTVLRHRSRSRRRARQGQLDGVYRGRRSKSVTVVREPRNGSENNRHTYHYGERRECCRAPGRRLLEGQLDGLLPRLKWTGVGDDLREPRGRMLVRTPTGVCGRKVEGRQPRRSRPGTIGRQLAYLPLRERDDGARCRAKAGRRYSDAGRCTRTEGGRASAMTFEISRRGMVLMPGKVFAGGGEGACVQTFEELEDTEDA